MVLEGGIEWKARQSVLPLAQRIACALSYWLAPAFGEGLAIAVDTDRIEALSPDRAALWERVSNAPFLTVNEQRIATGYGPVEGGDVFPRTSQEQISPRSRSPG